MTKMRAKFRIQTVTKLEGGNEKLEMCVVGRKDAYPPDGSDENNTFAKFSPSGKLELYIANPALWGKFEPGKEYYLDFTPAE